MYVFIYVCIYSYINEISTYRHRCIAWLGQLVGHILCSAVTAKISKLCGPGGCLCLSFSILPFSVNILNVFSFGLITRWPFAQLTPGSGSTRVCQPQIGHVALRWWLTAPTDSQKKVGTPGLLGASDRKGEGWLLRWSRFYQFYHSKYQELVGKRERGRAMILLLYFSTLLLVTWRPRYCYYHYCMLCYVMIMFRLAILICKISKHVLFLLLWHAVAVVTTAPGKSLQLQLGLWEGSLIFDEDPITSLGKDNILTICCCWELLGSQHCQKTSGLVATYIPTSHVFYKRFLGTSSESLLAKLVRNISRHGFQFFTIFWEVSDLDVLEVPQQKNKQKLWKNLRLRIRISFQSFLSSGQSGWWLELLTGI